MRDVVLAMPRILQYRAAFLEKLRAKLAASDVNLRVLHGEAYGPRKLQQDDVTLPWATSLPTHPIPSEASPVVWLPIGRMVDRAQLVIVPEAAGWLPTYEMLARRRLTDIKVACWGHGPSEDDQARNWASRRLRMALARRFDWWFTYTDGTASRLRDAGVPADRITTVYNTVDVRALRSDLERSEGHRDEIRRSLRLSGPTALYLGALRAGKRIERLLDIAAGIAAQLPDFVLIVGGDGPLRSIVERRSLEVEWLRYLGPVHGDRKVRCLVASDLILQPAWLGLSVLDAFAAGLPILTFNRADHSPEAEYLRDDIEGVRVPSDRNEDLVAEAVGLFQDQERLKSMGEAAWQAGSLHTLERMVSQFASGVRAALDSS